MIYLDKTSSIPLYEQIYKQIKENIDLGYLTYGTKLTSTREAANLLNVSRNTIERAYYQLCIEGYILNKPSSGYFVQNISNDTQNLENKNHYKFNNEYLLSRKDLEYKYNLSPLTIDNNIFPADSLRRYLSDALATYKIDNLTASYTNKLGEFELRFEILKYLKKTTYIKCNVNQIILCSTKLNAMDEISKLFNINERNIAFEDPGYFSIRDVFENNNYKITPISIDSDHINLSDVRKSNSKLIYVTPNSQSPLGCKMSLKKKKDLIAWANENNSYIIEDNYNDTFHYNLEPSPSLHNLDTDGRVIYVGTFSQFLAPAFHLCFFILPESLLPIYYEKFKNYYCDISFIQQIALSFYMKSGEFEKYVKKNYLVRKKRFSILIREIERLMGNKVIIHGNDSGLHTILEFLNGQKEDWLVKKAKEVHIKVYPLTRYWYKKDNSKNTYILIGLSNLNEEELKDAVSLLNKAWFSS